MNTANQARKEMNHVMKLLLYPNLQLIEQLIYLLIMLCS